jgi:phospholipid-binding lipoprotein MlaA
LSLARRSANKHEPDFAGAALAPCRLVRAVGRLSDELGPRGARPAGGAAAPAATAPEDPYEASNRSVYAAQSSLDRSIFLPLAKLYHFLTPGPIGRGIHNVLSNLGEPVININDVLQGRFKQATHDTLRLTANTTAGWLGLMDVATPGGLPHHDNDFGLTLGRWGVGPGPYLYLPLVGPSTVRDLVGAGADVAIDPLNFIDYPDRVTVAVTKTIVGGLDTRVQVQGQLDAILGDAEDPYATLRSVYLQSREAAIRGDDAPPALAPLDDAPMSLAPTAPTTTGAPVILAVTAPAMNVSATAAAAPPAPPTEAEIEYAVEHPDPDAPIATAHDWHAPMATAMAAPVFGPAA